MLKHTPSRIIAVTGASGAQGAGLARAILCDPQQLFGVRALTSRPHSPAVRELAGLGAEVIAVDLDDEERLRTAFSGAYGAFCVAGYWKDRDPERIGRQAAKLARA